MSYIRITWSGLDELRAKLSDPEGKVAQTLEVAGREAGESMLSEEGLRRYPASSSGNQPPVPYYIRGRGVQYRTRNTNQSERYGTRFYVQAAGMQTRVGNTASYAPYLTDDAKQSRAMARIGWRKLIEVARERASEIVALYRERLLALFE